MPNQSAKRIQSIKIVTRTDDSPDTSYLGEYSDTQASEFSVDRVHDAGCAVHNQAALDAVEQLERVLGYLDHLRRMASDSEQIGADAAYAALVAAEDIVTEAQAEAAACDCGSDGHWRARSSGPRYFNPSRNYVDAQGKLLPGNTAEDVRRYVAEDFDRMESLYAGNWRYLGIRAEATIVVAGVQQQISSGGLWGVESDAGDDELARVAAEELAELRAALHDLGFSKRAIAAACKDVAAVAAVA